MAFAPNLGIAQTKPSAASQTITGKIADFGCGDNCYLSIVTDAGTKQAALCVAKECRPWNEKTEIPRSLIGKRVEVTIGRGDQLYGDGEIAGNMASFTSIKFVADAQASTRPVSKLPACPKTSAQQWNKCQGAFTFADGGKYTGEWLNNQPSGTGTLEFPNGEKYVGAFAAGKFSGQGSLYAADGSISKTGRWASGSLVGESRVAAARPLGVEGQPPALADGRRVALVIGNSAYQHAPRLSNPANDAGAVAAALTGAGFQSVTVKSDLTREGFLLALRDFAVLADSADWAVVYYSGHGIEYGGVNYLIPVDANLKADRDVDLEAVDLGKALGAIDGAKALHLAILDACRENPFLASMRRTVSTKSAGMKGLARVEPDSGTLVVYAAKAGETALDGSGPTSPFAAALTKRLLTPNLEIRRLFDLVRDDVLESTNRRQQPFTYGSLSGKQDFFFVKQ